MSHALSVLVDAEFSIVLKKMSAKCCEVAAALRVLASMPC